MRHMAAAAADELSSDATTVADGVEAAEKVLSDCMSTTAPSSTDSPRSGDSRPWPALSGIWRQDSGETYEVVFDHPSDQATCAKTSDGKTVMVALRYDSSTHTLWLGAKWNFYVELQDFDDEISNLEWRTAMGKQHVRFTWTKDTLDSTKKQPGSVKGKGKGKGVGRSGNHRLSKV